MRKHKADFVIIGIMLFMGIVLLFCLYLSKNGDKVRVYVDGKEYREYSLASDGEYTICGENNGTNILVIKDGEAYISEASCPDKLCMNMGKIKKGGQSIICLPNKVVIEIESESTEDSLDGVAGAVYGK